MKSDFECGIDELTECIQHLECAILLFTLHCEGEQTVSEHIERMWGYVDYLTERQKDLECIGIDIENEGE